MEAQKETRVAVMGIIVEDRDSAALPGKIGRLSGVSVKTAYSNVVAADGNAGGAP